MISLKLALGETPAQEKYINHDETLEPEQKIAKMRLRATCCQALPSCKLVGPLQKFVDASHKGLHGQQLAHGKKCESLHLECASPLLHDWTT